MLILAACIMLSGVSVAYYAPKIADRTHTVAQKTDELIQLQKAGVVRGYKNRAVACRAVELQDGKFKPGDPCLDPEIRPYFTPGR